MSKEKKEVLTDAIGAREAFEVTPFGRKRRISPIAACMHLVMPALRMLRHALESETRVAPLPAPIDNPLPPPRGQ